MIRRNIKNMCKDFSSIENYELAVRDLTEVWHLHHKKEDEGFTKEQLIRMGMYYGRPAEEFVFLRCKEHIAKHNKGNMHRLGCVSDREYVCGEKHHRAHIIVQIDKKSGNVIREWKYARLASETLGILETSISLCIHGKYKSAGGFKWKLKSEIVKNKTVNDIKPLF